MKKLMLSTALLLAAHMAFAQSNTFTLKGHVQDLTTDTLLAVKYGKAGMVTDTILVKDHSFSYSTTLNEATEMPLVTPATLRRQARDVINILAVPGETAEVSGKYEGRGTVLTYSGSKFYEQYAQLRKTMDEAEKPFYDYTSSLSKRIQAGEKQGDIQKEYEQKAPAFIKAINDKAMALIKAHPDYAACATLIEGFETLDEIKQAVALLTDDVKNGTMKSFFIDRIIEEKEAKERAAQAQAAGVVAPDFTLKDINGKDLSLSSLKGKYVLLDFWGSWCIWCIKGMPKMKEYYNKYPGKFEILGIDCNDTDEKWRAAVKEHQLPWLHVYNPKGSSVLKDYGIQGFPTKILIGPDGKIVKTIVGEDPAFYDFMDEMFK